MPIAFCFMDDEGFLWEYQGNSVYTSEEVLSVGNTTNHVTINSTAVVCNSLVLNSYSIGENGYTSLPNGLLLQWGSVNITTSIPVNFSWPTPFAVSAFSVTVTPTMVTNVAVVSINTIGFQITSTVDGTIYYQVVGQ
jgi:hypothetical protein